MEGLGGLNVPNEVRIWGTFVPFPPTPAPYESCIQVRGRVNTKDDDRDAIFETPSREESAWSDVGFLRLRSLGGENGL